MTALVSILQSYNANKINYFTDMIQSLAFIIYTLQGNTGYFSIIFQLKILLAIMSSQS